MANTSRTKPGAETPSTGETNAFDNAQALYETNKKRINTIVTVVLAAIVGFFAYQKLYKAPRENKAATRISYAQSYFQQDSLMKALNGDGQHGGFLSIIKQYSGTKAANLANYYAGICYLQMNDPKSAIKYLKEFNGHGTKVAYAAYGALGDACMESGNVSDGIEYYNKAAGDKKDNLITPMYLFRAALAYEMDKKPDQAKELYKRIKEEYPQSQQARETDKNLARLGVLE